jgi:hypothetical protein
MAFDSIVIECCRINIVRDRELASHYYDFQKT